MLASSSPTAAELARHLALSQVELLGDVGSTLDIAHDRAAAGAPAGTLIVAESQSAGRGRQGRAWESLPGAGVWLTLIERPVDRSGLGVLSIRIGLGIAAALEPLIDERMGLKWPNDIYRDGRKLGGILVETRWRGETLDWVAIGVGVNIVAPPGQERAIGLESTGVSRMDALCAIVPFLRSAALATGQLTDDELLQYALRDIAAGRRASLPVPGVVQGIDHSGALVVQTANGLSPVGAGSLVLEGDS